MFLSVVPLVLSTILFTFRIFYIHANYPYCSMENGCPNDKCNRITQCGKGNGTGTGCAVGETTCEYKDSVLKENYKQLSYNQIKNCVQNFINTNRGVYPIFTSLMIDSEESGKNSDYCPTNNANLKVDEQDNYCFFISLKDRSQKPLPYVAHFYVGAQTCSIYWDIPSGFKQNVRDLEKVNYLPNDAKKCAESYLQDNKTKYHEYKNYQPDSLIVQNDIPYSHAKVTENSSDITFYTITGKSTPTNIYLVVGSHSCTVYGVNEKYYSKI